MYLVSHRSPFCLQYYAIRQNVFTYRKRESHGELLAHVAIENVVWDVGICDNGVCVLLVYSASCSPHSSFSFISLTLLYFLFLFPFLFLFIIVFLLVFHFVLFFPCLSLVISISFSLSSFLSPTSFLYLSLCLFLSFSFSISLSCFIFLLHSFTL